MLRFEGVFIYVKKFDEGKKTLNKGYLDFINILYICLYLQSNI